MEKPNWALIIAASALMGLLGYQAFDRRWIKFEPFSYRGKTELYRKVSDKANTDNDSITDHYEWAELYKKFGLEYDIHLSNPRLDLSKRQMKQFLEK